MTPPNAERRTRNAKPFPLPAVVTVARCVRRVNSYVAPAFCRRGRGVTKNPLRTARRQD